MSSKSSSVFDELKWVIQIRRTLEDDLEDENQIPVSIFNVPKVLSSTDPNLYTPQQVAIGPYHYGRCEVYEMERYKLAAAKRSKKRVQAIKFQQLVDQLMKLEPNIRACYHKYLDFNGETLAWMMAIDASFLLEFLQILAIKEGKALTRVSSRMSHLEDFAGRKAGHNIILRDIIMLENQIPLFVLRKMLEFSSSSLDLADETLSAMLLGLYKKLSPFKVTEESIQSINVVESFHLLDFMYDMIVPKTNQNEQEITEVDEQNDITNEENQQEAPGRDFGAVKKVLDLIWELLSKLHKGPVELLKKFLLLKPIEFVLKIPATIISNFPGNSFLKQSVQNLVSSQLKDTKNESSISSNSTINQPPLVEEIAIPSVRELVKSGIEISPTHGSISAIDFDAKTFTLYLPSISLDVNSEVVLRNLVAYEASNASGPLVFTRYTELMNGIIDTEEDSRLLREKGIIKNRLTSDEEVAKMWNGMSKSIRLTKVHFLDKVIEDVNKCYNGRWKIKVQKFMEVYVFGSWQFLTFLATVVLLLLTTLQAFCSIYTCSHVSYLTNIS